MHEVPNFIALSHIVFCLYYSAGYGSISSHLTTHHMLQCVSVRKRH